MRPRTLGLVLLVMACFAFNSVATRYLVSRALLDAASITIVRFVAGATMLAAILAAQGQARAALPDRRDWTLVLFLGGYALAIAYGYRYITAAAGTFVFYALVVTTMTLGGARPGARAIAGSLLALAGVGALAVGRVEGTTALGVALLALTGVAWGAYSLLLRRRGTPLATNAKAFVGLALAMPILALVERGALHWTLAGVLVCAFMGAVTTALAYALWARVLPELSAIEAGTMQLLVPVLVAGAGVVALGEPFGIALAVAGALVLAGMALSVARRA
ncbi:MAG TPA: DMT family transporter [Candidatus Thermoplasmatota archaeon]|nr:DMT family transporter [Candidatus Thermoplasmatota archaeon]